MKKSAINLFAFGLLAAVITISSAFRTAPETAMEAVETNNVAISCPTGTVTVAGCALQTGEGCWYIRTFTGRVFVNLNNFPYVNKKDRVSVTGTFAIDQDCNPCVLIPTSVLINGDC